MLSGHLLHLFCATIFLVVGFIPPASAQSAGNVSFTGSSGTCVTTEASFDLSNYYNQQAMRVTDLSGTTDVSGSDWDLAKDGAYSAFKVLYCEAITPGSHYNIPDGPLDLIKQKGFQVTESCNIAQYLKYPEYAALVVYDLGYYNMFSAADGQAVKNFYIPGGGLFFITDNCPHIHSVNFLISNLPSPLNSLHMEFNNDIRPYPLYKGNPVGMNQFGDHVAFTGVKTMSAGHSLSIPVWGSSIANIGVFGAMGTIAINRVIPQCSGGGATPYISSHQTLIYLDPPVQLVDKPEALLWGRIIMDTAFTRYYTGTADARTTTSRFAANVVVWLVNIEKRVADNKTSTVKDEKVSGCSSGDSITLKAPVLGCKVKFEGQNAPSCLALIVSETEGTTCVLDIGNATIGSYWIMMDGMNTSLQFSVTANSLTPRGTIVGVTGSCLRTSAVALDGCTDGSSVTIDWTLPYPKTLTLGLGSNASVCSSFTVSGTRVTCTFRGLMSLPRGRYQTYINNVASGIAMSVRSEVPNVNKVLCSRTGSISKQSTAAVTASASFRFTSTQSASDAISHTKTLLVTPTRTLVPTRTLSSAATLSATSTELVSTSASTTMTVTTTASLTATASATVTSSGTVTLSTTTTISSTPTATEKLTQSVSSVISHTKTLLVTPTQSMILTPTLTASATRTSTATTSTSASTTMTVTMTASLSATASTTVTSSGTLTISATTTVSTSMSWTQSATVTRSASGSPSETASRSWGCVNRTALQSAVQSGGLPLPFEVSEVAIKNGTNETYWQTPLTHAVVEELYSSWFTSFCAPARVVKMAVKNALGFELYGGTSAGITVCFPDGLPIDSVPWKSDPARVVFHIPPIPKYRIYARETVGLYVPLAAFTRGRLCNFSAEDEVFVGIVTVVPDVAGYIAALQNTMTTIIGIGSAAAPLAAADMQTMLIAVMMPCSSTYQRMTYGMYRSLSLFTLDDTFQGVVLGNAVAVMAALALHGIVAIALSIARKVPLVEASESVRFPKLAVQFVWAWTYSSSLFASLQLLTGGEATDADLGVAAAALVLHCIVPVVAMHVYVGWFLEADYYRYDFEAWRRGESTLTVRLLSTVLLPLGQWESSVVRRCVPFVSLQCRREKVWLMMPLWSPTIVAIFSMVRGVGTQSCVILYFVLLALHVALMALVVLFRPLRTVIETAIAAVAYAVTIMYLLAAALNLLEPASVGIEALVAVTVVAQLALLVARFVYQLVYALLIAGRLSGNVPRTHVFEWGRPVEPLEEKLISDDDSLDEIELDVCQPDEPEEDDIIGDLLVLQPTEMAKQEDDDDDPDDTGLEAYMRKITMKKQLEAEALPSSGDEYSDDGGDDGAPPPPPPPPPDRYSDASSDDAPMPPPEL